MKKNGRAIPDKGSAKKLENITTEGNPTLQSEQFKLNWADYTVAPVLAFAAGLWAFFHIWTAVNWDDLLYMSLSRHTVGQPWILNRYGHIYLLKFFVLLFGDTITGSRVFWCFLLFGIIVLTYWCSRLLTKGKSYFIPVIAVLMVLMQPVFGRDAGCPLTDFTVTFLVILGVFLYLLFLNHSGQYRRCLLIFLGLVFFWVVKSKEVGICLGVVFLGLGWDNKGGWSIRRFTSDMGWVTIGVLAGCVLLMMLDAVFIGDIFFSIRPSHIKQVFGTNVHAPSAKANAARLSMSWFSFLTMRGLFVPFLFYLLAGWKSPMRDFSPREKVIWLFPLALIMFLTFVRMGFYIIPRYFTPAIPVASIWASQYFWFDSQIFANRLKTSGAMPKRVLIWMLGGLAFVVALIVVSKQHEWAIFYKFNKPVTGAFDLKFNRLLLPEQILYVLVLMPLFVSVVLICGVLSKKRGPVTLFATWTSLFILVLCSLSHNIKMMSPGPQDRYMSNAVKSRFRFEPLEIFANDIQLRDGDKVLISNDIHPRSWMLGRNAKADCHMLNIYLNAHLDYEKVIEGGPEDLLEADYAYAIVSKRFFNQLRTKQGFERLLSKYDVITKAESQLRTRTGPMQILLLKQKR